MALSRYAVVDDDGLVLNVLVWDGATSWSPPTGTVAVPVGDEVEIGGILDSRTKEFTPGPIIEIPIDPARRADRRVEALLETLESNGALTNVEVDKIKTRGRG